MVHQSTVWAAFHSVEFFHLKVLESLFFGLVDFCFLTPCLPEPCSHPISSSSILARPLAQLRLLPRPAPLSPAPKEPRPFPGEAPRERGGGARSPWELRGARPPDTKSGRGTRAGVSYPGRFAPGCGSPHPELSVSRAWERAEGRGAEPRGAEGGRAGPRRAEPDRRDPHPRAAAGTQRSRRLGCRRALGKP